MEAFGEIFDPIWAFNTSFNWFESAFKGFTLKVVHWKVNLHLGRPNLIFSSHPMPKVLKWLTRDNDYSFESSGLYYGVTISLVSFATGRSAVTLNIHHRGMRGRELPRGVRYFIFHILTRVVFIRLDFPKRENMKVSPHSSVPGIPPAQACAVPRAVVSFPSWEFVEFNPTEVMSPPRRHPINTASSITTITWPLGMTLLCIQNITLRNCLLFNKPPHPLHWLSRNGSDASTQSSSDWSSQWKRMSVECRIRIGRIQSSWSGNRQL